MTNYLNSAMLSAGAACFGSIIEIEKNMSQAEINTLLASKTMMDAQPLMMTALQNAYAAKAQDVLISGLIEGFGAIGAGAVQLGVVGYGMKAAKADSKAAGAERNEAKITFTKLGDEQASVEAKYDDKDIELKEMSKKPTTNNSTNAPLKDVPKNVEVKKQMTAEELAEENKKKKAADKAYKNTSAFYSNLSQIFGPMVTGAAKVAKSPFDTDATKKDGTAQAMGTIIQGNQTAQSSNANMVQTYKEAFTNASQILAGIVSAQNH